MRGARRAAETISRGARSEARADHPVAAMNVGPHEPVGTRFPDRRLRSIRLRRGGRGLGLWRSEEHTSELQSLMRTSYAVFCLKKQNHHYLCNITYNTILTHNKLTNIQTHNPQLHSHRHCLLPSTH